MFALLGGEEYSMRSLFFTWIFIIAIIGGLLLVLVCVTHRYVLYRRKQSHVVVNNRYGINHPCTFSGLKLYQEELFFC